jgi:hypothetical protein
LLNRKNSFIKGFPDKTKTVFGRITQRSTGRQKQSRFLPVGKLLVKERSHFKRYSFFAFAACELSRYSPLVHFLIKHEKIRTKMYYFININVWGIKVFIFS